MAEDEIDLEIYFEGNCDWPEFEGGDVMDICNFNVDKLSFIELKR